MHHRLDEAKSDLLAKAAAVAGRGHEEEEAFLRRYYRHVAPEDLVDRDPVDVYGAAASHRATAGERPQGTAVHGLQPYTRHPSHRVDGCQRASVARPAQGPSRVGTGEGQSPGWQA